MMIKSRKKLKRKRGRGRREKRRGVTQKHPVEREIGQNRTNVIRKGNGILPGHFNGQQRPVSAENSNLELLSFRENAPCPPFTTDTIASNDSPRITRTEAPASRTTGNSGSEIILLFAPATVDIRWI